MKQADLTPERQADAAHAIAESCRAAADDLIAGGIAWYPRGRTRAATVAGRAVLDYSRECGITYDRAAAVIAICNLNNTWIGSLTQAATLARAFKAGRKSRPHSGLPLSDTRAWAILHGAPLTRANIAGGGDKTWNFYRNLCGDTDACTIDRWACRAAGVPDSAHSTPAGYAWIAEAYRLAADNLGWTPAETQAVAWTAIRGRVE